MRLKNLLLMALTVALGTETMAQTAAAHFDMTLKEGKITESVSNTDYQVASQLPACNVAGIDGQALRFDGYSNYVRAGLPVGSLSTEALTVSVVLAAETYPMMQVDVAATVMGMVAPGAGCHTLGVDMQRKRRPYAYFSADDKMGAVSGGGLFWLYRTKEERESLYRLGDKTDLADRLADSVAAMRRYAFGQVQQSQQMLMDHTTECQ